MFFKHINKKKKEVEMLPMHEVKTNDIRIKAIRIEHRKFYDSTWRVTVSKPGKYPNETYVFSTKVVRDDTQTAEDLVRKVQEFGKGVTYENLQSLDMKASIYYD